MGVQVVPEFVVFHRFPLPAATYQVFGLTGSTATSAIRPDIKAGPTERKRSPPSCPELNPSWEKSGEVDATPISVSAKQKRIIGNSETDWDGWVLIPLSFAESKLPSRSSLL